MKKIIATVVTSLVSIAAFAQVTAPQVQVTAPKVTVPQVQVAAPQVTAPQVMAPQAQVSMPQPATQAVAMAPAHDAGTTAAPAKHKRHRHHHHKKATGSNASQQ